MDIQITEDYVSFEIAELFREKGFDAECSGTYSTGDKELSISSECPYSNDLNDDMFIAAPTLQMAMKWLREVHKIDICVCRELDEYGDCYDGYIVVVYSSKVYMVTIRDVEKDLSYEEACEVAIKYCLTNLI